MTEKALFNGVTKSGKLLQIRYIQATDTPAMLEYINVLSLERTFIQMQGEQLTLQDEERYVDSQLKGILQKKSILLLAYVEDVLSGICGVTMHDKTKKHVATLHISVAKRYRNEGIGSKLIEMTLAEGKKKLTNLKIVTLTVYAANIMAISLYEKHGFIKFGQLPKGIVRNETYEDEIYMYKDITPSR